MHITYWYWCGLHCCLFTIHTITIQAILCNWSLRFRKQISFLLFTHLPVSRWRRIASQRKQNETCLFRINLLCLVNWMNFNCSEELQMLIESFGAVHTSKYTKMNGKVTANTSLFSSEIAVVRPFHETAMSKFLKLHCCRSTTVYSTMTQWLILFWFLIVSW